MVEAAETLRTQGRQVTPSYRYPVWIVFLAQDAGYRDQVVPPSVSQRVAVEAGRTMGWQALVGDAGAIVGIDRFGESAPASVLAEHFGFTAESVVEAVESGLSGCITLRGDQALITPRPLSGVLRVAPSKSETHRALVLAARSGSPVRVYNPLSAQDTHSTRDAVCALGAVVEEASDHWLVHAKRLGPPDRAMDCGIQDA